MGPEKTVTSQLHGFTELGWDTYSVRSFNLLFHHLERLILLESGRNQQESTCLFRQDVFSVAVAASQD